MYLNKWKGYHFKIYFKFSILLFAIFIALSSGYFFFFYCLIIEGDDA